MCTPLAGLEAQALLQQEGPALFASHDVLEVTLTADLTALDGDRRASPDRAARIGVASLDGDARELDIRLRTRGAFRLDPANCSFPPLRLDLSGADAVGTPFEGQGRLKLVSSCRPGRASYDELVVTEYLAYRTFALVTDASFRVRRLGLTLADERGETATATRTAFLIEEDEALARRLGAVPFSLDEGKNLPSSAFEPVALMTTALFQYMIGNADWSAVAGHNVEIFERSGAAIAVPYDFDFSGLVDAPYAVPPPDLGLSSVRERRYRGWCANPFTTRTVLERFRAARPEVLALWGAAEGISDETRRRAVGYLEEFFDAIATDERAQRRFLRDCRTPEG